MEQMLRNRIAEQEETLRQRKAAKKQRRGVATESLSDMSPVRLRRHPFPAPFAPLRPSNPADADSSTESSRPSASCANCWASSGGCRPCA